MSGAAGTPDVAQALLTDTIAFPQPGPYVYGEGPQTLAATSTSGQPVTYTAPNGSPCLVSGSTLTIVRAGSCTVTATQAASGSYAAATPVAKTIDLEQAPLTISADNQTKYYGAALPTLTASYTGLVNGDTSASLNTLPTLTTTATADSPVSSYTITPSGAIDPNYNISYVSGNLAVNPAPLTISADNQTKYYGAALPTLTASYTGLVNGDTSASLNTLPTLTTTATADSPVSSYTITPSGAIDPNYNISYVSGNLAVNPAPLTISADNQTKYYGAALPTLTASYTGLVNGDTSASLNTLPTLTTTATADSPVSSYTITPSGAIDPNYNISYVSGNLAVNPAPLTIQITGSENQGAAPTFAVSTEVGLVNGDTPAVITGALTGCATSIGAGAAPGSYAGTITGCLGLEDDNYDIEYSDGGFTVNPATPPVSTGPTSASTSSTGSTGPGGPTGSSGPTASNGSTVPAKPPAQTPAPPVTRPILSRVTLSNACLSQAKATSAATAGIAGPPLTVLFTLSERDKVNFIVTRPGARRVSRACAGRLPPTAVARALSPSRLLPPPRSGVYSPGPHRVLLSGITNGLPPGPYLLVVQATNAAGQRSPAASLRFTIVT